MLVEVELKDKPPKVVWYRHETLLKPGEPRVAMNYNVETGACSTTYSCCGVNQTSLLARAHMFKRPLLALVSCACRFSRY